MANLEAHAGPPPVPTDLVKFSVRLPGIEMLLVAGLLLRLGLAFLPGFGVDMGTFQAWANSLANDGPWNFYNETSFTDYAPGYMYVLWFIGEANQVFGFSQDQYEYILKIPSIIADIASAFLIYRILADQKPGVRLGATALYVFFPAALWIGPIWGQVDSILAFFLLLSVYYIGRDRPVHGAVAFTIGFLMKPQAIAALPFLAFWILRDNWGNWRPIVLCSVVPPLVMLVLITPFFEFQPWRLVEVLYDASNVANYRVNSFWAYNFWNIGGLFDQGFKCDSCGTEGTEWLGIATRYWGLSFFLVAMEFLRYLIGPASYYSYALGEVTADL
ncbi:MAG: glycosyltransferase family 39 protein, partial [Chloroflexi bacterium]|nr:glycosyltransferase family 39 protein [Chloroflexota bacterium]